MDSSSSSVFFSRSHSFLLWFDIFQLFSSSKSSLLLIFFFFLLFVGVRLWIGKLKCKTVCRLRGTHIAYTHIQCVWIHQMIFLLFFFHSHSTYVSGCLVNVNWLCAYYGAAYLVKFFSFQYFHFFLCVFHCMILSTIATTASVVSTKLPNENEIFYSTTIHAPTNWSNFLSFEMKNVGTNRIHEVCEAAIEKCVLQIKSIFDDCSADPVVVNWNQNFHIFICFFVHCARMSHHADIFNMENKKKIANTSIHVHTYAIAQIHGIPHADLSVEKNCVRLIHRQWKAIFTHQRKVLLSFVLRHDTMFDWNVEMKSKAAERVKRTGKKKSFSWTEFDRVRRHMNQNENWC